MSSIRQIEVNLVMHSKVAAAAEPEQCQCKCYVRFGPKADSWSAAKKIVNERASSLAGQLGRPNSN